MTSGRPRSTGTLPPRPAEFVTVNHAGQRRPRNLERYGDPSAGSFVCSVEWTGELLSDGRSDRYLLCAGTERWSLWIEGDGTGRTGPRRDMMARHGPIEFASELEAAVFLLLDFWRADDYGDVYSFVDEAGMLSEEQIALVAAEAWPHRREELLREYHQ